MRAAILRSWLLLRLPVLISVAFLSKDWLVETFALDEVWLTLSVIDVASTPASRVLIAIGFGAALLLAVFAVRRFAPIPSWLLGTVTAALLYALIWHFGEGPSWTFSKLAYWPLGLAVLVALTNLLPDQVLRRFPHAPPMASVVACLPIVAEIFGFRYYLATLIGGRSPDRHIVSNQSFIGAVASVFVPACLAALIANGAALVPLEQALRSPASMRIVAQGDFNGLQLDKSETVLFVTGHGLPSVARLDLTSPSATLEISNVVASRPQGLAYDPNVDEIYLFDRESQDLIYVDANTLEFKRSVHVGDVSPGDVWMVVDGKTDTLTLASEADYPGGTPFFVIDRRSGAILDRQNFDAGNLTLHPSKPLIYLTFFRRRQSLMTYDLTKHEVVRDVAAPPRLDRLSVLSDPDELLVAQPDASRILSYDPDTLALRGEYKTTLGARVAIGDATRNLILTASIATGELQILDRASGKSLNRIYLGPWLRSVAIVPSTGKAYVSSNGALYEVQYAPPIASPSPK